MANRIFMKADQARAVGWLQRRLAELKVLEAQTPAGWCTEHRRSYVQGVYGMWMCPECVKGWYSGDVDEDQVVGALVGGRLG